MSRFARFKCTNCAAAYHIRKSLLRHRKKACTGKETCSVAKRLGRPITRLTDSERYPDLKSQMNYLYIDQIRGPGRPKKRVAWNRGLKMKEYSE